MNILILMNGLNWRKMEYKNNVLDYLDSIGMLKILKEKKINVRYGNFQLIMSMNKKTKDIILDAIDIESGIKLDISSEDILKLIVKMYLRNVNYLEEYYKRLNGAVNDLKRKDFKNITERKNILVGN